MPAQIARTIIGRAIISTVSLDFASKDIHQYETMIYTDNNKFLDYCDKHKTLDEARQGHIYAIQYLLTERESTNDNSNTILE
jgi:hypothetical protein